MGHGSGTVLTCLTGDGNGSFSLTNRSMFQERGVLCSTREYTLFYSALCQSGVYRDIMGRRAVERGVRTVELWPTYSGVRAHDAARGPDARVGPCGSIAEGVSEACRATASRGSC